MKQKQKKKQKLGPPPRQTARSRYTSTNRRDQNKVKRLLAHVIRHPLCLIAKAAYLACCNRLTTKPNADLVSFWENLEKQLKIYDVVPANWRQHADTFRLVQKLHEDVGHVSHDERRARAYQRRLDAYIAAKEEAA